MKVEPKEAGRIRSIMRDIWRNRFRFALAKLSYIIFNPRRHSQKYAPMRHRDFRNAIFFCNNYVGPALMELREVIIPRADFKKLRM